MIEKKENFIKLNKINICIINKICYYFKNQSIMKSDLINYAYLFKLLFLYKNINLLILFILI